MVKKVNVSYRQKAYYKKGNSLNSIFYIFIVFSIYATLRFLDVNIFNVK